jgi:hypothetical protein
MNGRPLVMIGDVVEAGATAAAGLTARAAAGVGTNT